jgi:hypothetical protein
MGKNSSALVSLLSKKFLIFTGLSGSGKTRSALSIPRSLGKFRNSSDVFLPGTEIPSSRVVYRVSKSDDLAIEVWNDNDAEKAVRVCLPRDLVQEWVDHIQTNGLAKDTTARQIRDKVKIASHFSDQLHSFETILKALAFHQIENEQISESVPGSLLVPVGSDWNNRDEILGFADGLIHNKYVSTHALSLILNAGQQKNVPHFLILDEMNLSHVERYFADFLSAMESKEPIPLYDGEQRYSELKDSNGIEGSEVPRTLELPDNLFVIGTVNVDETTYQFSPKVLDRANVIEFRMEEESVEEFFSDGDSPGNASVSLESEAHDFVLMANTPDEVAISFARRQHNFTAEMKMLFQLMQNFDAEFGYRTLKESSRYIYFSGASPGSGDNLTVGEYQKAMDAIIIQKLLPKLHGSRTKLEGLLRALLHLCEMGQRDDFEVLKTAALGAAQLTTPLDKIGGESPHYVRSHDKLKRMCRKLAHDQFVSFAEA